MRLLGVMREERRDTGAEVVTLVTWIIWKERNNRIFNQQQRSWTEVAKAMVEEAMLWKSANHGIPAVWPLRGRGSQI